MITIKGISKSFGEKCVLNNLSYEFLAGKRYCLMSASGGGKTTLLNIILGLLKADSGFVLRDCENISAVFQEDRLCEPYSAVANILAVTQGVDESRAIELLCELGLQGSEHEAVNKLSGGMRRRVALARALLARGELLVLDEPFKGLDEETRARVIEVLLKYSVGKTVIVATHDIRDAKELDAEIINL